MPKPAPPRNAIYVTVDAWTLRCLYNRSDYAARIAAKEFVELRREPGKWRSGRRSVQVYYGLHRDGVREFRVKLQWHENEHGEILASGFKDPKQFCADGFDYHLHGGNRWWERLRREPQSFLGDADSSRAWGRISIWCQRRYGDWRRYKCCRFGPVEALWRARLSARKGRAAARS